MTQDFDRTATHAALMLIGDELLSGKIRDENGPYLAQVLRKRGVSLVEVCTIPDHVEGITQTLRRLSTKAQWIVSSGGVGPTHDDLTVDGIARGLRRPVVQEPRLSAQLRGFYGDNCNEAVLRMARVPQGAQLYGPDRWPVLGVPFALDSIAQPCPGDSHRVYLLPGIPALFRKKIDILAADPSTLPQHRAWDLQELCIQADESRFAAQLNEVVAAFPEVEIGSYPRWEHDHEGALRVEVRLTFESRVPGHAQSARDDMARRWENRDRR